MQIVKSRRFIAEALKVLLSKQKWHELIERSRFVMIDPEAEIDYGDEIEPPLPDSEEKDSGRNFAAAGVNELIPSISPAGSRIDG